MLYFRQHQTHTRRQCCFVNFCDLQKKNKTLKKTDRQTHNDPASIAINNVRTKQQEWQSAMHLYQQVLARCPIKPDRVVNHNGRYYGTPTKLINRPHKLVSDARRVQKWLGHISHHAQRQKSLCARYARILISNNSSHVSTNNSLLKFLSRLF
jgi:hypothetical protein